MTRATHLALGSLGVIAIGALLVPALASQDPLAIDDMLQARLIPPFGRSSTGTWHILGTDPFGRDLFTRLMLAARISLMVGVIGSLLAAALGVCAGAVSAWKGGVTDSLIMRIADAMLAFPRLILLLLCAALFTPGMWMVIIVLALTGWMSVARLVRADVLTVAGAAWVDASRSLGVPHWTLLARHVMPNALGSATVAATLGVGNAILLESGLAFLGLGVQPPTPSWGNMIAAGREYIVTAPWIALVPGVALIITVLACTTLGDAFRDRWSPNAERT